MSACIIELAEVRARRARLGEDLAAQSAEEHPDARFQFWRGASGKRYVHTIYSLLECPELPAGNFILVRRDADGRRTVLVIGRLAHQAPSLNLAEIRQKGAQMGANEVHVHLLAETTQQSQQVECDLLTGQQKTTAENLAPRIWH